MKTYKTFTSHASRRGDLISVRVRAADAALEQLALAVQYGTCCSWAGRVEASAASVGHEVGLTAVLHQLLMSFFAPSREKAIGATQQATTCELLPALAPRRRHRPALLGPRARLALAPPSTLHRGSHGSERGAHPQFSGSTAWFPAQPGHLSRRLLRPRPLRSARLPPTRREPESQSLRQSLSQSLRPWHTLWQKF